MLDPREVEEYKLNRMRIEDYYDRCYWECPTSVNEFSQFVNDIISGEQSAPLLVGQAAYFIKGGPNGNPGVREFGFRLCARAERQAREAVDVLRAITEAGMKADRYPFTLDAIEAVQRA